VRQFFQSFSLRGKGFGEPVKESRERAVVFGLSLQITFGFWFLGTINATAEIAALILALVSLSLLFIPCRDKQIGSGLQNLKQAFSAYPALWFMIAFICYGAVQGINPHAVFTAQFTPHGSREWWLDPRPYISWLPSGLSISFDEGGSGRALVRYLIPSLALVTLLSGIRQQRSLMILLWVIALNGVSIGLVGFIGNLIPEHLARDIFKSPNPNFFGFIAYPNFAATFLYLSLGATLALFCAYRRRALSYFLKSDTHLGIFVLALTLFLLIIATGSRLGTGLSLLLFIPFLTYWLVSSRNLGQTRLRQQITLAIFLLAGLGFTLFMASPLAVSFDESTRLPKRDLQSFMTEENRRTVNQLSIRMLEDRIVFGWGGGSFRWVFPFYQGEAPSLFQETETGRVRMIINHAHNDWFQFPIEFGIIGASLAFLNIVLWLATVTDQRRRLRWTQVFLYCSIILVLLQAGVDFPMQHPAILLLAAMLFAIAIRDTELRIAVPAKSSKR
jgi:putative inorganic carbon (HCO3(-)) transporter